jgi:hypothetical protein
MWTMGIYIMNFHYIQKQQYNEYMKELENLSNINYTIHSKMAASQRGAQPCNILHGVPVQNQCRVWVFLAGCWFTKNDGHAMSSAFLSPIGECPIDPEEADEELNADQVHKEWKEYYEH